MAIDKSKMHFFNRIASDWHEEHHQGKDFENLKSLCLHFGLNPGDTVLDIGSGTGRLIPIVLSIIGSSGRLYEADFSEEMLKIGREQFPLPNVFFLQCDAHNMAMKSACFDTVVCLAMFPHLSGKLKVLKEFHRLLKPTGRIIIAHQMSRQELNRFHKKVKGPVTKDLLPDKKTMVTLMKNAGFQEIYITDLPSLYLAQGKI